jgi:hypothetical protein
MVGVNTGWQRRGGQSGQQPGGSIATWGRGQHGLDRPGWV